ncbi:MAG: TIR domain-containing protein, partial [Rhodoferax sp.]|uniref:TIR domain-containing protein n=1 Tax=Rhodoferax sp. TaxID=50421 RepID=UPI003263BFC6
PLRITVHPEYGVNSFFRQLAPSLGDTAEQPRLPEGSRDEMVATLRQKYPNAAPSNIWIDKAHLWINAHGWLDPKLERLFHACCIAFSDRFFWFFELRERPIKPGLFGSTSYETEVIGLDKTSLGECLKDAAPTGQQAAWTYSGDRLKQLYQWLGGGHGNQAHPLAIQLLIEVARGRQRTPLDALQQLPREAEQRIEEALLGDLYAEVLSQSEQTLLQALALYREPIPHDHADELEQRLKVPQAWDGLYRRCLLPSDGGQAYFYLHGFIASWVRHQLGYESDDDTLTPVRSNIDRSAFNAARLQQLHEVVAACWLKQLGNTKRITQVNIERALEAFHHLLCAGQADGIQNIAIELLGTNLEWVHQRLWEYDENLRARHAPIAEQRNVLEYITRLDPADHKAWRFLGECWGMQSPKALECFRRAHELNPSFPQYLANLGKALIHQGAAGAMEFLDRLNEVRQQHPEAIDEYVIAVQADALAIADSGPAASALRQAQITQGDRNPAFYAAEAEYQFSLGEHTEATRFLDLAKQHGCANGYTESIRAKVLEAQGDGPAASALRQAQITQGDRNPAFYAAEAEYQLSLGEHAEANRFLDLAKQRGCADAYTESIRAKVQRAIKQLPGDQNKAASLKGKPLVYISYAWGGDSDRAVDGLQAQLASSVDLRRDRTTMQPGDSIRAFEQEIGRGACVVVVVSAKYMRSPDCMRELGFLWERSQRDGATFSQRVIPVVLDDAQIGSQADRIAHVRAWQEEKGRLEALVNQLGSALCGQSTTQALQDIHAFQAQLVDALTWLADQVMPRGFAALDATDYAPVVDLIKKRLS